MNQRNYRTSDLLSSNLVPRRRRRTTESFAAATRVLVVAMLVFVLAFHCTSHAAADEDANTAAAAEARLADSTKLLAEDALEGRGVGTKGLDKAADYIAEQFSQLGLKTELYDGKPFQKFTMVTGAELGEPNTATLLGPPKDNGVPSRALELRLGEDFTPLSLGSSGQIDLPLVFVGYGLTGKKEGYDDYAGVHVEGKVVIVLRHEPQQDNPHSAFNGTKDSPLAPFTRKLSNAYEHGAAAVIFVTDDFDIKKRLDQRSKQWQGAIEELTQAQAEFAKIEKPTIKQIKRQSEKVAELLEDIKRQQARMEAEFDPVLKFNGAGGGSDTPRIPVLHCRRSAIDWMIKAALGKDLATIEKEIDKGPTPQSAELTGWRIKADVHVNRQEAEVKNVVAILEGEGPHADETIVVGAHYDHLGYGGEGSFQPGKNEIHNGADDNGSGTAALVEVARRLALREKKLPRRVVFIAFTGEERGLVGSARYCKEPYVPLENTVAMLNMDMVGRLVDDKLIIQGVDTAAEFGPIIDRLNEQYGFDLTKKPGGFGPSDHASFYSKQVPVMHYFTGLHKDYHRPSDDFDKVNVPGMRRVAEMVADTAVALAEADERPKYVESKEAQPGGGDGDRPYFGSIPDFAQEQPGYALSGVSKDSPADKGGLKAGDIIVKLGDSKIGSLEDFDSALRKYKGGDKVPVVVKRANEEVTLQVQLAPPR